MNSRIRAIREALQLTQKQLARRLNISGPTLSEFENGKHQPNFDFIYNINREFYVNLYYLLYGEGEMFEERAGPLSQRLERLCKENKAVTRLLEYFGKSRIVRYYLLSQFHSIMIREKNIIEKDIIEANEEE
jgi:transcriptional regulator with XRE-family HTH domain